MFFLCPFINENEKTASSSTLYDNNLRGTCTIFYVKPPETKKSLLEYQCKEEQTSMSDHDNNLRY